MDGKGRVVPENASVNLQECLPLVAETVRNSRAAVGCPGSTTEGGVVEAKRRQPGILQLELGINQRRAGQMRERENVMIQMYNRGHADLDSGLDRLRHAFRQCSIDGTGWATVAAVSAALREVGVVTGDEAVLLLAYKAGGTHHNVRSEHSNLPGATSARLVYWPNITAFLEEDPFAETGGDPVATTADRKRRLHSTRSVDKRQAQGKNLRKHQLNDGEPRLPDIGAVMSPTGWPSIALPSADDAAKNSDPEVTPEPPITRGSAFADDVDEQDEPTGVGGCGMSKETSSGRHRLERGLRDVEAGLRMFEVRGQRRTHRQVSDTMDKIRRVLETEAGSFSARHQEEKCTPAPDPAGWLPHGRGQGWRDPQGAMRVGHLEEANGDMRRDQLDDNTLASAACTAGKKGDISALNDLANRVDLKRNDAFGRNALYYSCLCGHIAAAHFVAVRAYGGVEGIPERERWECRKNALSDEIRRYLDGGTTSRQMFAVEARNSDESRTVRARPPPSSSVAENPAVGERGLAGSWEGGDQIGDESLGKSVPQEESPPKEAMCSIASLFGCGGGGEEKYADY